MGGVALRIAPAVCILCSAWPDLGFRSGLRNEGQVGLGLGGGSGVVLR